MSLALLGTNGKKTQAQRLNAHKHRTGEDSKGQGHLHHFAPARLFRCNRKLIFQVASHRCYVCGREGTRVPQQIAQEPRLSTRCMGVSLVFSWEVVELRKLRAYSRCATSPALVMALSRRFLENLRPRRSGALRRRLGTTRRRGRLGEARACFAGSGRSPCCLPARQAKRYRTGSPLVSPGLIDVGVLGNPPRLITCRCVLLTWGFLAHKALGQETPFPPSAEQRQQFQIGIPRHVTAEVVPFANAATAHAPWTRCENHLGATAAGSASWEGSQGDPSPTWGFVSTWLEVDPRSKIRDTCFVPATHPPTHPPSSQNSKSPNLQPQRHPKRLCSGSAAQYPWKRPRDNSSHLLACAHCTNIPNPKDKQKCTPTHPCLHAGHISDMQARCSNVPDAAWPNLPHTANSHILTPVQHENNTIGNVLLSKACGSFAGFFNQPKRRSIDQVDFLTSDSLQKRRIKQTVSTSPRNHELLSNYINI